MECTLPDLVMGNLAHRNGFHQLLLRHKGVGKSTLLKCIGEAAWPIYSKTINKRNYNTSYTSMEDLKCPSTIIANAIGALETSSIQELNDYQATGTCLYFKKCRQ